jgi:hypothetical protein
MALAVSVTLMLAACGSGSSSDGSGGTSGSGGGAGSGGAGGTTVPVGASAHGIFEIHYVTGTTSDSSYTDVGGFMYDGAQTELVVWDKKKTEGECSLYTPRTPYCDACASGDVCVDTNVCRTPPSTHDVGNVTLTGLNPPSGANPLALTAVTNATGTTYLSAETLPVPPCTAGGAVSMSAAGKGDYPAFSIQTQCIAPLVVTNSSIAIESGKTFTLSWTPSTAAAARIQLTFDLSHHGGSKGKIMCDTADTGSLQVSGTLLESLIALGVTGYPKAYFTRALTGTTTVGSGQAQLKVYSDLDYVAQIPGLVSCQNDTECQSGQTCQVPGQMCGVSCSTSANCPTGQTCLSTTKICK